MVFSAYVKAQRAGQEAVRTAILDAATRLLVAEGVAALTVRRIAGEVGCSTKVIYTMFGGKDGLVEALWLEGFARFGRRLAEVPVGDDPVAYLRALAWAYRDYALAEPDYYRVMFQRTVPGFKPGPEAVRTAKATLGFVVRGVEACMKAGRITEGDPVAVAEVFWMAIHGAVSLELAQMIEPDRAADAFRLMATMVLDRILGAP
ncbi:TetR/AcrR family transcriptional regulator [Thermopolyspora sp. NPDC052614]|uniref:TetR/AcrR family transcriptional regulator n=1 Tax=Thermopolyspora sp. NPDC052614 TaxID=3155682 RepID=UPI0034324470